MPCQVGNDVDPGYFRASNITVEVPEVESEDGSVITPLTVSWPEGSCKYSVDCS